MCLLIKRGSTVLKNKTIILNKISTGLLNKENQKKKYSLGRNAFKAE